MKFNEQMSPKQSIVFVIVIANAVFITMQIVYGQGQVNNSTVANAKPYSYRNELINRIMNPTCTEKRFLIGADKPTSVLYLSTIEQIFKNCVAEGTIK
jgi:hypothetical protein